jgi:putative hydrolase of the HAD superfamily
VAAGIQLLTFDLDDTLWDMAPVLVRAEQLSYEWLRRHAPRLAQRYSLEGLRELRFELAQRQPELAHRVTALRIAMLRHALAAAGYGAGESEALAQQAFDVFLRERHGVTLFDAAEAVLGELSRHYRLGAITNGNVEVARLGLDRYFSLAINAEQLPRAKPHPEPFLAALALAGCAPAACIHIGDHSDHDIRGAQQLGIHTIWMNSTGAAWPGGPPPTAEIRQLAALPAAVYRIALQVSAPDRH